MGNEPGLSRAPTICETAHAHIRPRKIYPTAMTLPRRDEGPAVQESEVSLQ